MLIIIVVVPSQIYEHLGLNLDKIDQVPYIIHIELWIVIDHGVFVLELILSEIIQIQQHLILI